MDPKQIWDTFFSEMKAKVRKKLLKEGVKNA